MATQVSKALLVRLEALPGREDDVHGFLNQGLSIVEGGNCSTWGGFGLSV